MNEYKPDFSPGIWSARDRHFLEAFATNPDGIVSVLRNLPPEITGALCSRASRASGSLLEVLLKEYIYPIVDGEDRKLLELIRRVQVVRCLEVRKPERWRRIQQPPDACVRRGDRWRRCPASTRRIVGRHSRPAARHRRADSLPAALRSLRRLLRHFTDARRLHSRPSRHGAAPSGPP